MSAFHPIATKSLRCTKRTKAFREAPMSRHRRLKIEGGAFFLTLALADRGSDLNEERFSRTTAALGLLIHGMGHSDSIIAQFR